MLHKAEGILKDRFAVAVGEAMRELRREERKVMGREQSARERAPPRQANTTVRQLSRMPTDALPTPPPGITRAGTLYGWCACGKGLASVTVWPKGDVSNSYEV